MSQALTHIQGNIASVIDARTSAFAPYGFQRGAATAQRLSNYIAPVQFQRVKQDMQAWRDAISEMELAWYPMRVKAQRIYIDVQEDGYVKAILERRKDMTMLREYSLYQVKNGKRIESRDLTQQLENQPWFRQYISYVWDALLFGYTNIELGDVVDDAFPNISYTRRWNIRPDGVETPAGNSGPVLTSLVYALDGIHLNQDNPLIPLFNHWVPTPTNNGSQNCGYGLLYNVAPYQILLRNNMAWNSDFVEVHGQPFRVGRTTKTEEDERAAFADLLANMGSNAWGLLDEGDHIEFINGASAGNGSAWQSYDALRQWCEDIIAQLVLGHTDVVKSLPGKLGGTQTANKDGFNESLVEQAMNDKQTRDANFILPVINSTCAPRIRNIGRMTGSKILTDLFKEGYVFGFKNDKEENEIMRRTNSQLDVAATWAEKAHRAGLSIDAGEFSDWTGFTFKTSPQPSPKEREV